MNTLNTGTQIMPNIPVWVLALVMFWVLPWKGYALWLAARQTHKKWFVILLVVNTLAILDIIYIFFVGRKKGR